MSEQKKEGLKLLNAYEEAKAIAEDFSIEDGRLGGMLRDRAVGNAQAAFLNWCEVYARAALSHPAPDVAVAEEVEQIRARHEACLTPTTWASGTQAHADRATLLRLLDAAREDLEKLEAENADLKTSVIAFAGPAAVRYAADWGLPEGHLASHHYDILEKCGARMTDFTRAALKGT